MPGLLVRLFGSQVENIAGISLHFPQSALLSTFTKRVDVAVPI
jgi:hypothetical protein